MTLSDEDLATVLASKANKLESGDKARDELIQELGQLLADDLEECNRTLVSDGQLKSQGRAYFGRDNEDRAGVAFFVPDDLEIE